jgi:hypothetical protein
MIKGIVATETYESVEWATRPTKGITTKQVDCTANKQDNSDQKVAFPGCDASDNDYVSTNENERLIYSEKRETGAIKFSVYGFYFKSALGIFGPIIIVFLFLGSRCMLMSSDYWILYWYGSFRLQVIRISLSTNSNYKRANKESRLPNANSTTDFLQKRFEYSIVYTGIQIDHLFFFIIDIFSIIS